VQSMVQIAHNLDLILLGEGVESEDDVEYQVGNTTFCYEIETII